MILSMQEDQLNFSNIVDFREFIEKMLSLVLYQRGQLELVELTDKAKRKYTLPPPLKAVIINLSQVESADSTSLINLKQLYDRFSKENIHFYFANLKGPNILKLAGFPREIYKAALQNEKDVITEVVHKIYNEN